MFVDGCWVAAQDGRSFRVLNPATGEWLATVPQASARDVDHAVCRAAVAYPTWRQVPLEDRINVIEEWARRIGAEVDTLAWLDMEDLGSPIRAMRADVLSAVERMKYFCGIARELKGESLQTTEDRLHYTLRQPMGVAAVLLAFNHPLKFAVVKSTPALLMGNTVILKPSEQTPRSALQLAALTQELLPPGVINVITGDGSETGAALVAHPEIRKISLIGGVTTGRKVLHAAASTIKSVSLELGGKNPIIICPDADLDGAVDGIVAGMNFTRSQGQSCGSTSRLFLHDDIRESVLPRLIERVKAIRPGLPSLASTEMGCLVSREHRDRVLRVINDAVAEGAVLLTGGIAPDGEEFANGCFLEPTVLDRVIHSMQIAQEEVFGPVLSILGWSDESTLLQQVNDVIYGLTASLWTRDLSRAHRLAGAIEAGVIWINGVGRHTAGVPFGGWKQSGLGRAEHREELLGSTQTKAVTVEL